MKTRKQTMVMLAVIAGFAMPSYAERGQEGRQAHAGHGINDRQQHQRQRIGQGVRSGELTRAETRRLGQEQREIRKEERAYRSDGVVTRTERRDLHHDLNQASRHIYREKQDGQDRTKPRDPGVNARQTTQRKRIGQGVRSGELTREETRQLAGEQRTIRQEEREYKSDGVMTNDERKDLHQGLNQARRDIYREKHDEERR